jgi:hypothetical protein
VLIVVLIGAAASGLRRERPHRQRRMRCAQLGDISIDWSRQEQLTNASTIIGVAAQMNLPSQAAVIAVTTAMQESDLQNRDYGDCDSFGLFQQRPSQGWEPRRGSSTLNTPPAPSTPGSPRLPGGRPCR